MASNRLNIRGLSDEQLTWLKQAANKYNVSISAYVLMVLEQHIEQKEKQQAELILSSPLNEGSYVKKLDKNKCIKYFELRPLNTF